MTTRRHFLAVGSLTTILAAFIPAKLLMSRGGRASLRELTVAYFKPLVNSRFVVNVRTDNAVTLKLVSARAIDVDPKGRSFSLQFTGPTDQFLAQRVHELRHDEIGTFEVFMVPHHSDSDVQHYEVLFNRSV
ncbi:MAG: hypothetical protein H7Y43_00515 [Akkermansiaceae bacterium]|nr:hypothetical protein [Verrucomicrobiales bacterium]